MRTLREPRIPPSPSEPRPTPSRARMVVRRIQPWSVLKVSFLFYLCVLAILTVALVILYAGLRLTGLLDTWGGALGDILGSGRPAGGGAGAGDGAARGFQINGAWLLWRFLALGLGGVVLWSLINVLVAVLYNLIADVVGGIRITLQRKR